MLQSCVSQMTSLGQEFCLPVVLYSIYHNRSLAHRPKLASGKKLRPSRQRNSKNNVTGSAQSQVLKKQNTESDHIMNKGLFQEPHELGSKPGCEIFLNNFLTGSSQNNRQKNLQGWEIQN